MDGATMADMRSVAELAAQEASAGAQRAVSVAGQVLAAVGRLTDELTERQEAVHRA